MDSFVSSKGLTAVNLLIVAFFVLSYLVNYYQISSKTIQGVSDFLTVPFLIAMVVFTAIGLKYLTQKKRRSSTVISIALLGLCAIATAKSFF